MTDGGDPGRGSSAGEELVDDERVRALADSLPVLLWSHGPDGDIEFVNAAYCDYFGIDRAAARGTRWQSLLHPDDVDDYVARFQAAMDARAPFHQHVRAKRADGEWRDLECWAAPRYDVDGAYRGHVGSSADATERRRTREALETALEAERRARSRSESLERIAAELAVATSVDDVVLAATTALRGDGRATYWIVEASADDIHVPGAESQPTWQGADDLVRDALDRAETIRTCSAEGCTVVVPLFTASGTDGSPAALVVGAVDEHHLDEHEPLARAAAALIAGALGRARSAERERRAKTKAELIADVVVEIERCTTVADQLICLSELLVPRLADYISIESPIDASPLVTRHHDPVKATVLDALRRRNASPVGPVEPNDGEFNDRPDATASLRRSLDSRSHVAIPLRLGEDRPASMVLGLTDPGRRPYGDDDVEFLTEIGRRAGVVIAETRAREREHQASLRLQKALLPDVVEAHPQIDAAAHYQAASDQIDVGGDWYDTYVWPDSDRYALVVGDVVGHGVEAAAAMGRIRAAAALLVASSPADPVVLLDCVERATRDHRTADYLTAAALVVDPATETLAYSSAGHPPALLVRADGSSRWLDDASSGPVCRVVTAARKSARVPFGDDDLVIAYSDGLIERRHDDLRRGLERLRHMATDVRDRSVEEINRHLAAELGHDAEDDIVVAALRYAPSLVRHVDRIEPLVGAVRAARSRLRDWLVSLELDHEICEAITLATSEALTNAAEHSGVGPSGGSIYLRAAMDERRGQLLVTVADAGVWRRPPLAPVNRGRGTSIMERLSAGFHRTTGPGGTAVTLRFNAGGAPGS